MPLKPDTVLQTCLEVQIVAYTRKAKNKKLKRKIHIPLIMWHEKSLQCVTTHFCSHSEPFPHLSQYLVYFLPQVRVANRKISRNSEV